MKKDGSLSANRSGFATKEGDMVSHRKPKDKLSYEQLEGKIRVLEEEVKRLRSWNKEANSIEEELTRPFCDECPAVKVDFGYFNPFTGDVRPPDNECPVDWAFGTEGCLALRFWKEGLKRCEEEEEKATEELIEDLKLEEEVE